LRHPGVVEISHWANSYDTRPPEKYALAPTKADQSEFLMPSRHLCINTWSEQL